LELRPRPGGRRRPSRRTAEFLWAVVEGRPRHYNGSIQIFPEGEGCRLIWIADVLPNEIAPAIAGMMQQGMDAMKRKLDGGAA
jgi:hypothetical protein